MYLLARLVLWMVILITQLANAEADTATFIPAKSLDTERKFYFSDTIMSGLEGWTWLHYEIDENGKVVNPLLLGHSEKTQFIEEAFELVEGLTFEPALLNGVPVPSSRFLFLKHVRNVGPSQNKSAGEDFAEAYGKVLSFIGHNELVKANNAIQEIKDDFKFNLARQAWLAWASAMLNYRQKNYAQYLQHLTVASNLAEDYLSSSVVSKLYMNLFEMQMYAHRYVEAEATVDTMLGSEKVTIDEELAIALYERIEERYSTQEPYFIELNLEKDQWTAFRMHQQAMSLNWQAGALTGLVLRCDGENLDYTSSVTPEMELLDIASDRDNCVMLVTGATGEKLRIAVNS